MRCARGPATLGGRQRYYREGDGEDLGCRGCGARSADATIGVPLCRRARASVIWPSVTYVIVMEVSVNKGAGYRVGNEHMLVNIWPPGPWCVRASFRTELW
eukprot:scaffold80674_cov36-Tisochrysis_lutea.AAC.2